MRTVLLVLASVAAISGCDDSLPPVTLDERERVTRVAEPVVAELMQTLVGRLTSALEEGGPLQAMELCSTEAIPLTRGVESGAEGALSLKRTSFRYRNPENAPDRGEEEALLFFERSMQNQGSAPGYYVQRVSEEEIRYYRPVFVGEPCLGCHGKRESMDPQVIQLLSETYPGDLATGYEAGDFRGLVRVSVSSPLEHQP